MCVIFLGRAGYRDAGFNRSDAFLQHPVATQRSGTGFVRRSGDIRTGRGRQSAQKITAGAIRAYIAAIQQNVAIRRQRVPDRAQRIGIGIQRIERQNLATQIERADSAMADQVYGVDTVTAFKRRGDILNRRAFRKNDDLDIRIHPGQQILVGRDAGVDDHNFLTVFCGDMTADRIRDRIGAAICSRIWGIAGDCLGLRHGILRRIGPRRRARGVEHEARLQRHRRLERGTMRVWQAGGRVHQNLPKELHNRTSKFPPPSRQLRAKHRTTGRRY